MAIIGIDLGTTNSVAAYINRGKVEIIPIEGKNTMSSVLGIRGREIVVGESAKARLLIDPENTVASSKRDIGKNIKYTVGDKIMSPGDIAYEILNKIREKAASYIGEEIEGAVVTVPAYFTPEQRKIIKAAAERARLNILRLVPEPTAAALDYGINEEKNQIIMVYDLGGGTFDISIMRIDGNKFEILSVDGDSKLGGDDFDNIISEILYKQINDELGINLNRESDKKYISAKAKIKEASEKAKKDLSDFEDVGIIIPNLIDDYCLEKVITREEFNEVTKHLVNKTLEKVDNALNNINYTEKDIDKVILVGGSTKMPIIRETIAKKIKEPYMASNVDEVVARGAAFMATMLSSTASRQKTGIDIRKKVIVQEKTVFSYGVDILDKDDNLIFKPIIKKGTTLPADNGIIGFTSRPYQDKVEFNVYRGENIDPEKNEFLGQLDFNILEATYDFVPVLALFSIDESMIIRFRSVELPTTDEYMELIKTSNINKLKTYVDLGKLVAKEVFFDTNANRK